jgi:hypothetical protein
MEMVAGRPYLVVVESELVEAVKKYTGCSENGVEQLKVGVVSCDLIAVATEVSGSFSNCGLKSLIN